MPEDIQKAIDQIEAESKDENILNYSYKILLVELGEYHPLTKYARKLEDDAYKRTFDYVKQMNNSLVPSEKSRVSELAAKCAKDEAAIAASRICKIYKLLNEKDKE